MVEVYRGPRNLATPHVGAPYPGIRVVRPGREWSIAILCPEDGATITALGGERAVGYDLPGGGRAEGFELRRGDRARLALSGLPFALVEWHVERVASPDAHRGD